MQSNGQKDRERPSETKKQEIKQHNIHYVDNIIRLCYTIHEAKISVFLLFNTQERQSKKMKNANEILNAYKEKLIDESRSKNTIEEYVRDVRQMLAFTKIEDFDSSGVKQKISEWRLALDTAMTTKTGKPLSAASINRKVISVRNFLTFAGISITLKGEKIQQSGIENMLSEKEYLRLIRLLLKEGENKLALICQTLAATGLRISELKHVTAEALRAKTITIRNGKGGKCRKVAINNDLAKQLRAWKESEGIEKGILFRTKNGNVISNEQFSRKLKKFVGEHVKGLAKSKVHAHAFRHFFALQVLEKTSNISIVQQLLGHANPSTTMIYLRQTEDELSKAVESVAEKTTLKQTKNTTTAKSRKTGKK